MKTMKEIYTPAQASALVIFVVLIALPTPFVKTLRKMTTQRSLSMFPFYVKLPQWTTERRKEKCRIILVNENEMNYKLR